jgi:methylenetetrahydrofolate reductase (NADPH)
MALLNFKKRDTAATARSDAPQNAQVEALLEGYSIEVMPRTAEKVEDFADLLPRGTRVYIAHIEGTPIEEMVATAKRLADEGYPVMPHFPARIIKDKATLKTGSRATRARRALARRFCSRVVSKSLMASFTPPCS